MSIHTLIEQVAAGADPSQVLEGYIRQTLTPSKADVAYKGYLIRTNPISKETWIEKDKAHIGYAKSVEDAKRIIDGLVSEGRLGEVVTEANPEQVLESYWGDQLLPQVRSLPYFKKLVAAIRTVVSGASEKDVLETDLYVQQADDIGDWPKPSNSKILSWFDERTDSHGRLRYELIGATEREAQQYDLRLGL